ncbi:MULTISPECIES: DUF3954 domain-containing protein [Bhargavaea]|uniref:DUF3954 domain-containing protein n=1 Tax=Bhargavaea changchunensis TaxID=2134037 RepID=A0ABW2NEF8_9BACL|nr:DUF3954 domain-containing protein [Bhargavaea sp. CC-171006]
MNIKKDENAVYIVKDGKVKKVEGPPHGFGKQTVTWQHGKPSHVELNYSEKVD